MIGGTDAREIAAGLTKVVKVETIKAPKDHAPPAWPFETFIPRIRLAVRAHLMENTDAEG